MCERVTCADMGCVSDANLLVNLCAFELTFVERVS
jgi:hypothetical protein